MSDEVSEQEWKRRFGMLALLRVSGLLMMLAGVFVGMTGLVKVGGMPVIGIILVIIGAIDGIVVPVFLRKAWKRPG